MYPQFQNRVGMLILISLLKWYSPNAVSFITASHTLTKRVLYSVGTFLSQNRVYFLLFLQELSYVRHFRRNPVWLVYKSITTFTIQLSRRKFNNYSDTVCHYTNLFHWWKCAPKKSIFTWYSLPHYRALHCAAFILQSLHPVSTFGIKKVCGLMKTLPVIQKMLVSLQILALAL